MAQRRLIRLLIAGVVLAGVLVVLWNREPPEPEYGGKKLSEWLAVDDLSYFPPLSSREAGNAIRHMGNQAVPFLLQWMQYETPAWKQRVCPIANRVLARIKSSWVLSDEKSICRADAAMMALVALGPEAANGVPALARLATDPKVNMAGRRATIALRDLPVGHMEVRMDGPLPAGHRHIIWPSKTNDPWAGAQALQDLLQSGDPRLRSAASNALIKIDPKLLEREIR